MVFKFVPITFGERFGGIEYIKYDKNETSPLDILALLASSLKYSCNYACETFFCREALSTKLSPQYPIHGRKITSRIQ